MDVAIVTMASWGDVIISTLISKAIKEQRPNWHITYYTSSACAGAIANNPHIDKQEIIPATKDQAWAIQDTIITKAKQKHQKVITPWAGWYQRHDWLPLHNTNNKLNFMWAYVRSAQLEGLQIPEPPELVLHPTQQEYEKTSKLIIPTPTIALMEVEGHSSQSWLNQSWIDPIMNMLTQKYDNQITLLISKGGQETKEITQAKQKWPHRIILLNNYTLREVAILSTKCQIFIGCSSGTSNACHGKPAAHRTTPFKWFEAIKEGLWESSPLGIQDKTFYYGSDPIEFSNIIKQKL